MEYLRLTGQPCHPEADAIVDKVAILKDMGKRMLPEVAKRYKPEVRA